MPTVAEQPHFVAAERATGERSAALVVFWGDGTKKLRPTPPVRLLTRGTSVIQQDNEFQELIRRVRAREEDAATELVRRFKPEIHSSIRLFLSSFRLRRVLDISDISQPVLATFFARVVEGHFQVDDPEQLLKLLATMARNKVRDEARRHRAQRRDGRRLQEKMSEEGLDVFEAKGPTPSQVVAGHELLAAFYRHLTVEERRLAEQRTQGMSWAAIAVQEGSTTEAVRKKLSRGCNRAARLLGMADLTVC
jgi:DNA-directed RNA polymerase specialized sigma24 family protein